MRKIHLLKLIATISFITFLSRVLGFIRDTIIARVFGANMESDAFLVAFKIPNLLRRVFSEGIFSQVLVPVLVEYKNNRKSEEIREFISYISGLLTLVLLLISFIGVITAPWIILITAPGFSNLSDKLELTTELLRITFPYIFFVSFTSLISAILNTWNYFAIPALAPALLNISIISFSLFATPFFFPPILALAWAVLIGGILQLIYQLPYLKKIGMLVLPNIRFCYSRTIKLFKYAGPAIFGISISQISLFMNTFFASFLMSGSISWMYYADRLIEFPTAMLGVTLGTILLPSLSKNFVQKNYEEYSRLLDFGIRLCLILALPSSVAIIILANPLVITLFQYDSFSSFDTIMTQKALIAYSIGLVGLVLIKVLAPGFYSRKDIKTPVQIAIITLFVTQIMNFVFIGPLKHAGLSLSVSLSACFHSILLYWQLRRKNILKSQPGFLTFCIRLIIAVATMAISLIYALSFIPDWSNGSMSFRVIRIIFIGILGLISYILALWMVGFRYRYFSKFNIRPTNS